MADTIKVPHATPYCLRYFLGVDLGIGEQNTITIKQSDLVADCAAGPLKETLRRPAVGAQWVAVQSGEAIPGVLPANVVSTFVESGSSGVNLGFAYDTDAGENVIFLSAQALDPAAPAGAVGVLEIRYNHTAQR